MEFQVVRDEDERTFLLEGELDIAAVEDLVAAVQPHATLPGDLTLDLSGLAFVDSSGLRAFIRLARDLGGRGRLVLRAASPPVERVFEITRLGTVPNIHVCPDR